MSPDRPPADADTPLRIPVLQEDLRVSTETVRTGAVRVRVRPEVQVHPVPLQTLRTDVDIERVAIGRVVDAARAPWQDGDDWVVPVYEETVVLQRRLVLKEELRLRPRRQAGESQQAVSLWHDVVKVERRGADGRWAEVDLPLQPEPEPTEPERPTPSGPSAASLDP